MWLLNAVHLVVGSRPKVNCGSTVINLARRSCAQCYAYSRYWWLFFVYYGFAYANALRFVTRILRIARAPHCVTCVALRRASDPGGPMEPDTSLVRKTSARRQSASVLYALRSSTLRAARTHILVTNIRSRASNAASLHVAGGAVGIRPVTPHAIITCKSRFALNKLRTSAPTLLQRQGVVARARQTNPLRFRSPQQRLHFHAVAHELRHRDCEPACRGVQGAPPLRCLHGHVRRSFAHSIAVPRHHRRDRVFQPVDPVTS